MRAANAGTQDHSLPAPLFAALQRAHLAAIGDDDVPAALAGLPTLPDDADALRFLTTGALPGGRQLLPPMPQYRFDAGDARAVLAYLRRPKAPGR